MVLTKTEAEARRTCDQGVGTYLADRHQVHIQRSLAYGVIGGIIPTSALFIISAFYSFNRLTALIPLAVGIFSGIGYGVYTADDNDGQHEEDFETVCSQFEEEEDEDDSEDGE